jgi:hypothetical protein
MVLRKIQSELASIYQTPLHYDVADFLITDAKTANDLTPARASTNNQERLLVQSQVNDLRLSLYIDAAILAHLAEDDPIDFLHEGNLTAFLIALEGVSHLNYVIWNGERDQPVTLFELELQAEIDKYVACAKLFSSQQQGGIPRALHQVLFNAGHFDETLDTDSRQRYLEANYFAGKYCADLRRRFPGHHAQPSFLRELRSFYRMSRNQKVTCIRSGPAHSLLARP